MKTIKFKRLAIGMAILTLMAGCVKEQSELQFDSVSEKARISGLIVYDSGVDQNSEDYRTNLIVPADSVPVYVEIDYSEYKPGSDGKKIFETVTDENGVYEIEVPVISKGVAATVRMKEFIKAKTSYVKMDGDEPVFKSSMYKYTYELPIASLKPGAVEFFKDTDTKCKETPVRLENLDEIITFKGKVALAYEKGFLDGAYKPGKDMTVRFEVQYPGIVDQTSAPIEFTYGTQTNSSGEFTIHIPVKSIKEGFKSIVVTVQGKEDKEFIHYSAPREQVTLQGAYKSAVILNKTSGMTDFIESEAYDMKTIYMPFEPKFNHEITENPEPSTWTPGLQGWEQYNGFTERAAVKGKFLVAKETAYKVGTFSNDDKVAAIAVDYPGTLRKDKTIYVPTDAEGNFTLELPVSDAQEVLKVTPTMYAKEFIHYINSSNTQNLKGTYSPILRKENGAKWNEMGEIFMRFTPTPTVPPTWDPNLAGWQVFGDKKKAETLTAKVYVPVETAYAKGDYRAADKIPMTVNVAYGAAIDTYETLVENGVLNTTIYLPEEQNLPQITLAVGGSYKEKQFTHYLTKEKKARLEGTYSINIWEGAKESNRTQWNDLGNCYLKFVTADPTWNANLAGWVKDAEKTVTKEIKAQIQVPYETSFGKGDYKNADGLVLTFDVKGKDGNTLSYAVPAESGKISFKALLEDINEIPEVTIQDMEVPFKAFVHYMDINGKTRLLDGKYKFTSGTTKWIGQKEEHRVNGWNDLGSVYLNFAPTAAPANWKENLAGWVKDPERQYHKQVTAKAYVPVETEYGKGQFLPANGLVLAVSVKGEDGSTIEYSVPAVNGEVAFETLLKYAEEQPKVSIADFKYEYKRFKHYEDAKGKVAYLEGNYEYKAGSVGKLVKTEGTQWNVIGDLYCEYVPTSATQPENWAMCKKFAGWAIFPKYEEQIVTGAIYWDREVGFRDAQYQGAAHRLVTVSFTDAGETHEFVGVTDAYGMYNVPVKVKYADVLPTNVKVTPDFAGKEVLYDHYRTCTATPETAIERYKVKYPSNPEFRTFVLGLKVWTDRGSDYYLRETTFKGAPAGTDNTQDLAGLINTKHRITKKWTKALTVQGNVMKAIQLNSSTNPSVWNWEPKWTPDAHRLVRVTVKEGKLGTHSFDTYTSGSGSYHFTINVPDDATENFYVTVVPVDDKAVGSFRHHPDPNKSEEKVITGKFKSSNNINNTFVTKKGTLIEINNPCAKMRFYPEGSTPAGWLSYSWNTSLDK